MRAVIAVAASVLAATAGARGAQLPRRVDARAQARGAALGARRRRLLPLWLGGARIVRSVHGIVRSVHWIVRSGHWIEGTKLGGEGGGDHRMNWGREGAVGGEGACWEGREAAGDALVAEARTETHTSTN